MNNVFITGGAGFVGSHCVISLVKNGYKPIILDNFSNSSQNIIKKLEIITNKKITFYKVDLRNKKKLNSIFKKHKCHCVIHCAAETFIPSSFDDPFKFYKFNLNSTLNILEYCRIKKVSKFIYLNTYPYGVPKYNPIDEVHSLDPHSPYTKSKLISDGIAKSHPMKRIGKPEDAASMAKFLLSDESPWITGQIIGVDGGKSSLS